MENQEKHTEATVKQAMEPVLQLNPNTVTLPEALGMSVEEYKELALIVDAILRGKHPELGQNDGVDTNLSVNLDLPKVLLHLQAKASNINELILLTYFFGNGIGQITAHMEHVKRDEVFKTMMQSMQEAADEEVAQLQANPPIAQA